VLANMSVPKLSALVGARQVAHGVPELADQRLALPAALCLTLVGCRLPNTAHQVISVPRNHSIDTARHKTPDLNLPLLSEYDQQRSEKYEESNYIAITVAKQIMLMVMVDLANLQASKAPLWVPPCEACQLDLRLRLGRLELCDEPHELLLLP